MEKIFDELMEECYHLEEKLDELDLILQKVRDKMVKKIMKELMQNMVDNIKLLDNRMEIIKKLISG